MRDLGPFGGVLGLHVRVLGLLWRRPDSGVGRPESHVRRLDCGVYGLDVRVP